MSTYFNPPPGFVDLDFTYIFDIVMALSTTKLGLSVSIEPDADFLWRSLATTETSTAWSLQYRNAEGRYLSSAPISSLNLQGQAPMPYMIWPEVWYPAGQSIAFDMIEQSGAQNTIQLAFKGIKRFKLGSAGCPSYGVGA